MLNRNSNSPLSLFIMLSMGLHIIGASLFVVFAPKIQQVHSVEIVLQPSNSAGTRVARQSVQNTLPIKEVQQEVPVSQPIQAPTQPPIQQQSVAQVPAISQPVQTPTPVSQPVQTPIKSTPVQPAQPVALAPSPQPVQAPTPVAQAKPVPQQVVQQATQPVVQQVVQTNRVVAQQPTTNTAHTVLTNSSKDLSEELDQLLAQKTTSTTKSTDELADATWSGAPRKTISFPNIVASIPGEYKARGYGFSVTAKITFSQQGWVSSVELTQGSGDPRIDGIFRTELRKIRVEPIQVVRSDTITKTFKVSVK